MGTVTTKLDSERVGRLLDRARRDVDDGLLPAVQIAVGLDGEIVLDETFGADPASRFIPFSCTKAIVAGAVWQLIDDGSLDVSEPVASYLPEFATNGKDGVTVEHVLLHTGGFPFAPLGPGRWGTESGRRSAYAKWRLNFEPGQTYMYHPTAGHWVLVSLIETLVGEPYGDAIHRMVTEPLGLPRLLGIPVTEQEGIQPVVAVGEPATADDLAAAGLPAEMTGGIPADVAVQALLTLNDPEALAVGVPGGGSVVRAADLALLYQGFLHDPAGLWSPEVLAEGTAHVRNMLPDMFGTPASRTLGLIVAGDDGLSARRGMGATVSPRAFGHNGAGGQIAFADPASGLSVVYLTNGLDQNLIREQRRVTAVASLAAVVLADR